MPDPKVDREQIEALADILDEKGLSEVEYQAGDLRIRVVRAVLPGAPPVDQPVAAIPAGSPAPGGTGEGSPAELDAGDMIISPMVGTFYAASSPEAPPLIEVGDRVRKGQVVCIIEAMKLMNEIESEYNGVVAERLVENAQGVEFGQPLFRIEARGDSR